jgi:hypothetical protein
MASKRAAALVGTPKSGVPQGVVGMLKLYFLSSLHNR